jgi:chromate transporter
LAANGAITAASGVPLGLALLFLVMLKIGATIFGGGYVLVAFLRSDLVVRLRCITARQLLDGRRSGRRNGHRSYLYFLRLCWSL